MKPGGSRVFNTVGIIGAGQLGQMLEHAATNIGLSCTCLDISDHSPVSCTGNIGKAACESLNQLSAVAKSCDVVTYEFENVPAAVLRTVETQCPVWPSPTALEYAQDRLAEKKLFQSLGIPVTGHRCVDSAEDLRKASESLGLPLIVKTRRLGYDGKGQRRLESPGEAASVFDDLGGRDLVAEQIVPFDREVSAIGARGVDGEIATYALSKNEHREGILRIARAEVGDTRLASIAHQYLKRLMIRLGYVGILTLELFVLEDQLLANEFAPRVHNSGHWTIEGAKTSQFENHLRAITGMPLGDTSVIGFPGMVNIIGKIPEDSAFDGIGDVILHNYEKSCRPGRKLGHATIIGENAAHRDQLLLRLNAVLAAH